MHYHNILRHKKIIFPYVSLFSYPAWLWTVHIPYPTPNEMSEMSYELMDEKLKKRYYKINRRALIKQNNADTTK